MSGYKSVHSIDGKTQADAGAKFTGTGMTISEYADVDNRVYVYSVLATALFHDMLVFLESLRSSSSARKSKRSYKIKKA